jgi:hypothetical protein
VGIATGAETMAEEKPQVMCGDLIRSPETYLAEHADREVNIGRCTIVHRCAIEEGTCAERKQREGDKSGQIIPRELIKEEHEPNRRCSPSGTKIVTPGVTAIQPRSLQSDTKALKATWIQTIFSGGRRGAEPSTSPSNSGQANRLRRHRRGKREVASVLQFF